MQEDIRVITTLHAVGCVGQAAHYREATRSQSNAEFISKIEGALQEPVETAYWLEQCSESGVVSAERLSDLQAEANELTAILVTCEKLKKAPRRLVGRCIFSSFILPRSSFFLSGAK